MAKTLIGNHFEGFEIKITCVIFFCLIILFFFYFFICFNNKKNILLYCPKLPVTAIFP